MPTYLYECEKCGRFEEFQKITDEPLEECPKCEGEVRKIIGSPGIIFKGSGFYSTDNGESSSTVSNGSKTPSDKKAEKSDSSPKSEGSEKVS
jgi:putative FmdB family regulatory protein